MRLLKASSIDSPAGLELVEFTPNQIPPYAILSHTWGENEVLFADVRTDVAETKAGYKKIRFSCIQAIAEGLDYVWVDTCCIDKSSSAELSEAINSMYHWYLNAAICYAYLEDFSGKFGNDPYGPEFANCRWFTRGWTLQELLAPHDLAFYSAEWEKMGEKSSLSVVLSKITGIDEDILVGKELLESASIARRMSWAAQRQTSRPEDKAYCLMGIFSVNMPLLYGEGGRAFLRLQEEIIKYSNDQTIFAWIDEKSPPDIDHGLLARSPAHFRHSKNCMRKDVDHHPFSMSNIGLRIDVPLGTPDLGGVYRVTLNCSPHDSRELHDGGLLLAVYLRKISPLSNLFVRVQAGSFTYDTSCILRKTIYVPQPYTADEWQDDHQPYERFSLQKGPKEQEGYRVINVVTSPSQKTKLTARKSPLADKWIPEAFPITFDISKASRGPQLAGAILLEHKDKARILIMLGSTTGFQLAFDAITIDGLGVSNTPGFAEIQSLFNPKLLKGSFLALEGHRVCVRAEPRITSWRKIYSVHIEAERTDTSSSVSTISQGLSIEDVGVNLIKNQTAVLSSGKAKRWTKILRHLLKR